jgi:hypothetical protein
MNLKTATKEQLLREAEQCNQEWRKWSCDCLGYYIQALYKRIGELNEDE